MVSQDRGPARAHRSEQRVPSPDASRASRFLSQASAVFRETEFLQVSKGRFEAPLTRLLSGQRNRTLVQRELIVGPGFADLFRAPWSEAHRVTREVVSIGDLIDGSRADLARAAAAELAGVGSVAACLAEKFAEVLPEVRLDWALRFSQFDEGVDLRSLAILPRWQEVDFLDRHDLQSFADWLFAQVDAGESGRRRNHQQRHPRGDAAGEPCAGKPAAPGRH